MERILDAAGWLGLCFCGYAAFLVAITIWKGKRPDHAAWWMKKIDQWGKRKNRMRGWARTNELWIGAVFSAALLGVLVWMGFRTRYPIATYHNVIVMQQLPDGDWPMSADEDHAIVFRPCADFDVRPMLSQAAIEGWIAHQVKWEQQPTCQSVLAPELGFTFNDENFQYRRISDAKTNKSASQ